MMFVKLAAQPMSVCKWGISRSLMNLRISVESFRRVNVKIYRRAYTICVLDACSPLGGQLCQNLVHAGHKVKAVVRS
jgi:hypothetical protein